MRLPKSILLLCMATVVAQTQTRTAPKPGRFDARIEQRLAKELHGKAEFGRVRFGVEDGVVTLAGKVRLHSERMNVENRARSLEHVSAVRNFIVLDPPVVSDDLLFDRLRTVLRDANLEHLNVKAHEGRVELSGEVYNRQQWSRAVNLVWNTLGVREAEFQLRVRGDQ
jgi:osmotically-inducible protein OsmY